jgi:hypothetical protein
VNTASYRKTEYANVVEVTWPRLVLLDQSGEQLLDCLDRSGVWLSDKKQWNIETLVYLVMNALPWHGVLLTAIRLPFADFKDIENNLETFRSEISRIVIHGNPYEGTSREMCEIYVGPFGATIHVLSEDFFTSVQTDIRTPWELALWLLADSHAPRVTPNHFDTHFSIVGLASPFWEVLLMRNVNPYVRSDNPQTFRITAYECSCVIN